MQNEQLPPYVTLDISQISLALLVLGAYVCLVGQFSYWLKEKAFMSSALISTCIGIAVGPIGLNWISPWKWTSYDDSLRNDVTYQFCRLVIGIQVMFAGIDLPAAYLRREWRSLTVLLLPIMTIAWFVSAGLILAVIPALAPLPDHSFFNPSSSVTTTLASDRSPPLSTDDSKSKKRPASQDDDDVAAALLNTKATDGDESMSSTLSKNQKKKLAKKLKSADGSAVPAPEEKKAKKEEEAPAAKKAAAPAPQTLAGGLVILDSKKGDGPVAKNGKKVGMRYIGKLDNGKTFDSNTKGAPLVFTLGRGEVIKGWDMGVAGMAVGGERKLTIPAALAYGKKGTQGIPGNATLHFDVKLVTLK